MRGFLDVGKIKKKNVVSSINKNITDILEAIVTRKNVVSNNDENITDILEMIVLDASYTDIINKIVALLKKPLGFSACSLYELDSRNKIRPVYSDICFEVMLKFRQKQIFKHKPELMRANDITPEDDEDSVYHPIVLGKKLHYVFVFDGFSIPEKRQEYLEYMELCKKMKIIMGCLHNAVEMQRTKYMDGLTNLPNEIQLRKDIERCISCNKDYVLATIEIDDMACYNDKYGVFFGDKIVKSVAVALNPFFCKNGNGLYRFFGAKFAVLLDGTQEDSFPILKKAQKCVNAIELEDIHLSCTIGAVEIQYLDKAVYDVAYQKVIQAMRVEKGSICFSGERRQLEKEKAFSSEKINARDNNTSLEVNTNAFDADEEQESNTAHIITDAAIEAVADQKIDENEPQYSDTDIFEPDEDCVFSESSWTENNEEYAMPEFCEDPESIDQKKKENILEENATNNMIAEQIKKKTRKSKSKQNQEIPVENIFEFYKFASNQ